MPTQSALLIHQTSHPLTLTTTHPIPLPGPSHLQLRTHLTALNPHDQLTRDTGLFASPLPAIPGSDLVGTITALGPGTSRFQIGDVVFGQASITLGAASKGLQEYAILEEDFVARVPDGIGRDEVATVPTNGIAGVVGIFGKGEGGLGVRAPWEEGGVDTALRDEAILIIGGGANCGRFAVQLARMAGFGKIVVVGGEEEELKGYGATHVVGRHGGHDVELGRVREVVGDGLGYAFDVINAPGEQHLAINALSNEKRGRLARLKWSRGEVDKGKVGEKKGGYELKNVLGFSHLHRELTVPFWRNIGEYLVDGRIRPLKYVVEYGLDADKVNAVLDRYRDGEKVTQTHFHISE